MDKELEFLSNNKYVIKGDVIGKGAFCDVYECVNKSKLSKNVKGGKNKNKNNKPKNIDINLEKYVVKVIKNKYKKEFVREINVFNKINKHKNAFLKKFNKTESNIINLCQYYIGEKYAFLIFEYMTCDLYKFVKKFMESFSSRLPIEIIKKILQSVCSAIHELNYNNLIHGDIKPNNIMIKIKDSNIQDLNTLFEKYKKNIQNPNSELIILDNIQIKLIDLNKSVFINEVCKSLSVQTLEYQSPEIVLGNLNYNEKIDIWSIGSLIWFLTTGHEFIDIYNYKKIDEKFIYYSDSEKSDSNSSDSESYSSGSDSDSNNSIDSDNSNDSSNESSNPYSSYSSSILENYIYLNKLYHLLGPIDDDLVKGKYIGNYFYKKKLIGYMPEKTSNDFMTALFSEMTNFSLNSKEQVTNYINLVYNLLYKKVFIYDIKNRIDVINLQNEINNIK